MLFLSVGALLGVFCFHSLSPLILFPVWGGGEWSAFLRCAYGRAPSEEEWELFERLAGAGGAAAAGDAVGVSVDVLRGWLTNLVLRGQAAVVWHFLRACGGYDGRLRIVSEPTFV